MSNLRLPIKYIRAVDLDTLTNTKELVLSIEKISVYKEEIERMISYFKNVSQLSLNQKNKTHSITGFSIYYILYSPKTIVLVLADNTYPEPNIFKLIGEVYSKIFLSKDDLDNDLLYLIEKYQESYQNEVIMNLDDTDIRSRRGTIIEGLLREEHIRKYLNSNHQSPQEENSNPRIRTCWQRFKWKFFLLFVLVLLAVFIILPIIFSK